MLTSVHYVIQTDAVSASDALILLLLYNKNGGEIKSPYEYSPDVCICVCTRVSGPRLEAAGRLLSELSLVITPRPAQPQPGREISPVLLLSRAAAPSIQTDSFGSGLEWTNNAF